MFFTHLFEADIYYSMSCIPMSLRLMLDEAAIKLHLKTWNQFSADEQWDLALHPVETSDQKAQFTQRVSELIVGKTHQPISQLEPLKRPTPWEITGAIPPEILDRAKNLSEEIDPLNWKNFHTQQRFALVKLAKSGHDSNNFLPALREFRHALAEKIKVSEPHGLQNGFAALDAVVLAGGKSSRFGSDKTQLPASGAGPQRGGSDLTARAASLLTSLNFRKVWVSSPTPRHLPCATDLPDDVPDLGPLGGIATALLRAPYGVFVIAADMPAASHELVASVVNAWDGQALAVAPKTGAGTADESWEPLCAVYTKTALPALYRAACKKELGLQRRLNEWAARTVELPPHLQAQLTNINTVEDWQKFQQQQ